MPAPGSISNKLEEVEGMGIRSVYQEVDYDDFTDGGSTAGTKTLTQTIPAGSFVVGSKVNVLTGFTGDTSCTLDIGVNGGDADAYSYTTHNIYTAATNLLEGADSSSGGTTGTGFALVTSATTVLLTATSASDWGLVTAGKIRVWVYYLSTNPE